jgi:hypothetical protein
MDFNGIDRRGFLKIGAAAGALVAVSFLPGATLAEGGQPEVRPAKLKDIVDMSPEDMARASAKVMAAQDYIQKTVESIKDQALREKVKSILANPAPTFMAKVDGKVRAEFYKELTAKGLLKDVAEQDFLPPLSSAAQSPQPFLSAPGSGWGSHHAYPGGVVTHTALNLMSTLGLYDGYIEAYGLTLDRDALIASQALHDLHKPWVFQWQADGSLRNEMPLAGTGEHHTYGVTEVIARGLPASVCVAQACAHEQPGGAKEEALVAGWIGTAGILTGTDPVKAGLLDSAEKLPQPLHFEGFVTHLGDHDWVVSVPSAKCLYVQLKEIAATDYGLSAADLAGRKFNSFRNYVLSQGMIETLYVLYATKGREALAKRVKEIVIA